MLNQSLSKNKTLILEVSDNKLYGLISDKNFFNQLSLKPFTLSFDMPVLDKKGRLLNESLLFNKLKQFLKKENLQFKHMAISVSSNFAYLSEVKINNNLRQNVTIEKQILKAIENRINANLNDIYFDYQRIKKDDKTHTYVVAIVHDLVIEAYQNLAKKLDVKLKLIDIDHLINGFKQRKTAFNLLSDHQAIWQREKRQTFSYFGLSILIGICIVFFAQRLYTEKLNTLKSKTNQLNTQLIALNVKENHLKQKVNTEQSQLKVYQSIKTKYQAQSIMLGILNLMAEIIPKNLYLTELNKDGDHLTLTGKSKTQLSVTRFIKSIKQSPFLKGVTLNKIKSITSNKENQKDVFSFEITANSIS